jgi:hypothetical protein
VFLKTTVALKVMMRFYLRKDSEGASSSLS